MRVEGKRYRDQWLPNFYPSREIAADRWLLISRTGKTVVLSTAEDRQISEIFMDAPLYERLERTGHILTPANAARVFEELKLWQLRYYAGPELHIVVTTARCNLACTYCHMNPQPAESSRDEFDMSLETARAVVEFAMSSPNSRISFEFQGGEPFLNFAAIRAVVEHAEALNRAAGKEMFFSVVTNLMMARDEHLAFCRDHEIRISFTVNGPQAIHDHYRRTGKGTGSFAGVMRRLRQVQARFPGIVSATPLCVIDDYSAPRLEQMIDFYYDAGFEGVGLIRLKPLGFARKGDHTFDITRFMGAYLRGLEYILEKNRSTGRAFREYMVPVVLAKILGASDTGFVDWRNPCGDISGAIIYDFDGEILPADEARSMRNIFGLGNVRSTSYEELVRRKDTFHTMNLSLRDRDATCRECAYNPYCGVMPVLEYARTGSMETRPHESEDCLYTLSLLDWTFKKLLKDPLPLMLMIPSIDEHMDKLLEEADTAA
jgi:uncharacterized protein